MNAADTTFLYKSRLVSTLLCKSHSLFPKPLSREKFCEVQDIPVLRNSICQTKLSPDYDERFESKQMNVPGRD